MPMRKNDQVTQPFAVKADFTLEMCSTQTAIVMDALADAHAKTSDPVVRSEMGAVLNALNDQWRKYWSEARENEQWQRYCEENEVFDHPRG